MTKNLTKAELALRGTPIRMDTSLPGETDSCRGKKKKIKDEENEGKEKVQKYKKRPSQKDSVWEKTIFLKKNLRSANKISSCFMIYTPAKLS